MTSQQLKKDLTEAGLASYSMAGGYLCNCTERSFVAAMKKHGWFPITVKLQYGAKFHGLLRGNDVCRYQETPGHLVSARGLKKSKPLVVTIEPLSDELLKQGRYAKDDIKKVKSAIAAAQLKLQPTKAKAVAEKQSDMLSNLPASVLKGREQFLIKINKILIDSRTFEYDVYKTGRLGMKQKGAAPRRAQGIGTFSRKEVFEGATNNQNGSLTIVTKINCTYAPGCDQFVLKKFLKQHGFTYRQPNHIKHTPALFTKKFGTKQVFKWEDTLTGKLYFEFTISAANLKKLFKTTPSKSFVTRNAEHIFKAITKVTPFRIQKS